MGFTSLGMPLEWDEASKYAEHVREHGITQFLHIWDRGKGRQGDEFLWGDEIEYMVIALDDETRNAKVSLRQTEILEKLERSDKGDAQDPTLSPTFQTEYARYMLESTPGTPYMGAIEDLLSVESNMHYRRLVVKEHLSANEVLVTITSFPRLGAPGIFTDPYFSPDGSESSHSLFLPEETISPNVRYRAATANRRRRRGSKVTVNLPVFIDEKAPRPFVDPTIPLQRSLYPEDAEARNGAALIDHIYMDAPGFGGGCCCLQVTFQSDNMEEARRMYDAFTPLGPIMLALTAASPIWRCYLSDVDCRWSVLSGICDDRNAEERGHEPLKKSRCVVPRSRCDSVDLYLSMDQNNKPGYNDIDVPRNEKIYERLVDHGVDKILSEHVARMFIRDPVVVFSDTLDQDDATSDAHFQNLQSSIWGTLRFKPPPPHSPIGWRVEFRSMEVQLTDFENAAFAIFMALLSRAVLAFNLNFYIPLTKVDENMSTAQRRDAVCQGKFFFRKNVFPPGHVLPILHTPLPAGSCSFVESQNIISPEERKLRSVFPCSHPPPILVDAPLENEYEEMSMQEIFEGKGAAFPGLIGLVETYLETLHTDSSKRRRVNRYLDLVRCRANGSLLTTASWMRRFVRSHPSYKFDSVVSQEINYDLMVAVDEIERGVLCVPELLPKDYA